jgi:uncharacterized protein YbaR (Trm112 family)
MKKHLIDILACPICKGKLELTIDKEEKQEIISGSLYCVKDDIGYPIKDAIPNLLPPSGK